MIRPRSGLLQLPDDLRRAVLWLGSGRGAVGVVLAVLDVQYRVHPRAPLDRWVSSSLALGSCAALCATVDAPAELLRLTRERVLLAAPGLVRVNPRVEEWRCSWRRPADPTVRAPAVLVGAVLGQVA